jgi:hypothetical protein
MPVDFLSPQTAAPTLRHSLAFLVQAGREPARPSWYSGGCGSEMIDIFWLLVTDPNKQDD